MAYLSLARRRELAGAVALATLDDAFLRDVAADASKYFHQGTSVTLEADGDTFATSFVQHKLWQDGNLHPTPRDIYQAAKSLRQRGALFIKTDLAQAAFDSWSNPTTGSSVYFPKQATPNSLVRVNKPMPTSI